MIEQSLLEISMVAPSSASSPAIADSPLPAVNGCESAQYTRDMLETLKRIAVRHEQIVLARLLEAASHEAGRLVHS